MLTRLTRFTQLFLTLTMDGKDILGNLSTHLKNTVARAIQYAASLHHTEVTPLHLLFALDQEKGSLGAEILQKLKIYKDAIERTILLLPSEASPGLASNLQTKASTLSLPELNKNSRTALEKAMLLAYEYEHKYVGTEHLLFGIIQVQDRSVEDLLKDISISKKDIENQMNSVLTSTSKFPEMEDMSAALEEIHDIVDHQADQHQHASEKNSRSPKSKRVVTALDVFTTNLTKKDIQKNIDPVVGRNLEIERLIDILCRRTKNNPVLVGEPGVGKTAIVEGLAKRIVEGNVPDILKNKKILSLDLTLLISGTIYRGEFEARLKQTIEELSQQENIILFIDEIHNIIGAGSNQGTMDAANILKPALARGQLRCIGATTLDEYKKYISSDPALERRFQSITVEEPNREDTLKILGGVKKNYEAYHGVVISEAALQLAVDLSIKYIHDNFLPDKAIDLLDEASASVKVRQKSSPLVQEQFTLEKEKEELNIQKQEAIINEKFTEANTLKEKIEKLEKKLIHIQNKIKKQKKNKLPLVQREDIARVVHRKLHIDEKILLSHEWEALKTLAEELKQSLVGQDRVIDEVVSTLKRSELTRIKRVKPLASFLFAGPSGVGKTALAKLLAQKLYHNDEALIKLDMSEFAEQHGVSKLLGSPAGYIGYKERNYFTDKLRRRPFSVVLFDEIDRAHPDVVRLLLQILDEGELTESGGKKISFKNTIIILTTNLGSEFYKSIGIGFGHSSEQNQQVQKAREQAMASKIKESLDPALIARLSRTLSFEGLSMQDIEQIIQKRIQTLSEQFKKLYSFSLESDASAVHQLALTSSHADEGARLVEKVVDETIQNLVIEKMEKENMKKKFYLKEKQGKIFLT